MISFDAIILAAGRGSRLGRLGTRQPKGLVVVGSESLVGRSVRQLLAHGANTVTIVTGHMAQAYNDVFADHPNVKLVNNASFSSRGSLESLTIGLGETERTALVLDSDIIYEDDALAALITSSFPNAVLVTHATGSGDEVWATADDDRLLGLSKKRNPADHVVGEFVGICRIGPDLAKFLSNPSLGQSVNVVDLEYEDMLSIVCRSDVIGVEFLPSLRWGEVDDIAQLERVRAMFG